MDENIGMSKNEFVVLLIFTLIFIAGSLYAGDVRVLQENNVTVYFEHSLERPAKEIAAMYPAVKSQLESNIGWDLTVAPTVLLLENRKLFQGMAESPLIVAFAVPAKNLIVIDYSRMNMQPFTLDITLKHELCHLLLHHHIREPVLPRWLDEGVCQWVSDGMVDIIMDQKRSFLNRASMRGKYIRLDSLKNTFPYKAESLLLAYEESKSFVTYIIAEFGKEAILSILSHMKKGMDAESAILKALSIPLNELEKQWHDSLKSNITWLAHLSYHLYDILFAFMALLSICAFIRVILKKRAYSDEEMDNDDGGFDV